MNYQWLLTASSAFPACVDRADYKRKTGKEAPDYDRTRDLKFWWDASAGEDGLPEVIYQNNIMLRADGTWALRNGAPVTKPLVMSVEEAKTVNLPPEDITGGTQVPPAGTKTIACPFRDLQQDEVLSIAGAEMGFLSGKVIVIRNVKLFSEAIAKEADDSGKFTAADRAMLRAIAAKLGV